jgi:distribution and morphology protein 34
MSFNFNWPREFSSSFYDHAKQSLEQALNQGGKLALVADKIAVRDLHLGSVPPELDLLGIDELSIDGSFVGRFMLSYAGDAFISLAANLQVRIALSNAFASRLLTIRDRSTR